jgi:hypothetical protein
VFDGNLRAIAAYDAAVTLANDTVFDADGALTCVWMDQHYNWSDATFRNRSGESLNLAVNQVADVLHTFFSQVVIPELPTWTFLPLLITVTLFALAVKKGLKKKTSTTRA